MRKRCWNVVPHVGPQAVAAGEPQPVRGLVRGRRRVDADSGTARRCTGTAVHSQRTMSSQNSRAENFSRMTTEPPLTSIAPVATHAADAVIHRQAVVHAVARLGVHHAREPEARMHQTVVVDVGGLGQSGRARRVDVERAVVDRERRTLVRRRRGSSETCASASIDARKFRPRLAVNPDAQLRGSMSACALVNCASSSDATMTCLAARR